LGAEPGEGFVDAFLEGKLGSAEDGISFVHWDDVGAAGGRSAGPKAGQCTSWSPRRPVSSNLGSVVGCGLPVVQLECRKEEI
jgi:hypothetical protein